LKQSSQTLLLAMVELETPHPTVQFVDSYCQMYHHLFPEVKSFEAFKYIHVGLISEIKRKTLPAIAKVVGARERTILASFPNPIALEDKGLKTTKIRNYSKNLIGTFNHSHN
jgi:SRSO17 transposase